MHLVRMSRMLLTACLTCTTNHAMILGVVCESYMLRGRMRMFLNAKGDEAYEDVSDLTSQ